ncbi:MAG TPA: right-handed parallel beta-helix repeat-containing protein, partial [Actinomycetota bacterium]|nr:right-handed parallel beta-helix repeat-containing protein [Actinomycetota bacterium]
MRRRLRAASLLGFLLALAFPTAPARAGGPSEEVQMLDNVFGPAVVRVPVGAEVIWTNEGRSLHNVTADDDAFVSTGLSPGASFSYAFDVAGAYPYHCTLHGAPGVGMTGVVLVGDAALPGGTPGVGPGRETPPSLPGATIRVPQDAPTIQAGVDAAEPGGLVLISPGEYHEAVVVTTPFVTIRGTDRNSVILDGGLELDNGVSVLEADGVVVENLTARHFLLNGLLWTGVFGYRASYVTAYDNGDYGVFAYDSAYGQFDHSYASGHPDSGFYIGQCSPCHAVVTDVLAENNALGFSGTNAGGQLFIVNSEWRNNMSGIVPNTLDSEERPPQRGMVIAGNWVHDNDNADAPAKPLQYPSLGIGIIVNGGRDDLVTQNLVEDHPSFGIALLPSPDRNLWLTEDNQVRDNLVRGSGLADLALAAPAAGGDCFADNRFSTSLPPAIEWWSGCGTPLRHLAGGDLGVAIGPLVRFLEASSGDLRVGDWRTQPSPPPQDPMPAAEQAPPNPAIPEVAVPQPFRIRDARTLDVPAASRVSQEVTVLGFPLSAGLVGILIGLYAYALPLILYSAWVSIALWDLIRQEAVPNRVRVGWMAAVLIVPLL